jgi:DNA polymerase
MSGIEPARREYLNRMGIDVWVRRNGARINATVPADGGLGANDTVDWGELQRQVAVCERCELSGTRIRTVFGVGDEHAEWMFVGEAPGAEEDRQGLPFVGRAGQLLNAMLQAVGLRREQVFIANVLKCRPPNNRDPLGEEVRQCEAYLHRQVDHVRPKIIIALGRFAAQSLLKTIRPIGSLRGEVHRYADTGIPLIVTYHPAYLLRNPVDKREAWRDLCLARKLVAEP